MAAGRYVPDWQRALIALSATTTVVVVIAALYWARSIFLPIALAVFLAFVLGPVVAWLQRRGCGRVLAVILTVGFAGIVSAGTGAVIAQQVVRLADDLSQPERAESIKTKVVAARNSVIGGEQSRLGKLIDDVTEILFPKKRPAPPPVVVASAGGPSATANQNQIPGNFSPVPVVVETDGSWMSKVEEVLTPATEFLGQGAFAFILTVYILLRREDLRNRMIRLTGHGKVTTTTKAVDDASRRISRYLLTQVSLNGAFGIVILCGLLLIGVEYALLWGFIAFVMRYVPYVGTWVGLVPPTLFAFAMSENPWTPLAVLALFGGLELLCNNIFEPMLYGQSMGLSEVAQLVSAALWAFLWGPIGLILSGPLTVCLLVLGKYVARFQFLEVLLGDEPALAPRVAFYQRLTAHDQDEAADIALTALKEVGTTPERVFDQVVVPALCLAKRDLQDGDLSAEVAQFAVRATREIAEEVALQKPATVEEREPDDERVRVLLCPARDEMDQLGIELFAYLLEPEKWEIETAAVEILASELLARVEEFQPAAVVIGSLPPGGLAHTRYLVMRVHATFPHVKTLVGRWGRGDDFPDAEGTGITGADWVDNTLGETRARLTNNYSVFCAAQGKPEAVGTSGASYR